MAIGIIRNFAINAIRKLPPLLQRTAINAGLFFRKLRLNHLKTPLNITLYVTSRCNARCKHCFYASKLNQKGDELSLDELRKIATSLKHRLETLMISGGEPFIRNDLKEICRIFAKENKTKRITIDTNGLLAEKIISTVESIASDFDGSVHVQVSLDGPEKIHDSIRGVKGCYKKAISTIKGLEEICKNHKNVEVSIMTTICDINFPSAEKFAKDFAKLHPNVLHKFNIMRGSRQGTFGLPKEYTSCLEPGIKMTKTPEELRNLFANISRITAINRDKAWQDLQKLKWQYMTEMLETKKKILACTARKSFAVIYQNGDVTICEPMKPFGNLKETDFDFERLWNSKKSEKYKEAAKKCYCIHPCNLLDSISYDANAIEGILKNEA